MFAVCFDPLDPGDGDSWDPGDDQRSCSDEEAVDDEGCSVGEGPPAPIREGVEVWSVSSEGSSSAGEIQYIFLFCPRTLPRLFAMHLWLMT